MNVPFLDLRVVDESELAELMAAVEQVLRHGRIIGGPEVEAFEQAMAARCGRRHAIGVGSGTDALVLALRALGIGPGDEVIVPAMSFVATANAVSLVGAQPVFADVSADLTLDPASIRPLAGPRTRAIVAVHWGGKVARMEDILDVGRELGVPVIEDAAPAFGAHRRGRPAGSFGHLACFSMNCMKVLASLGEGGAVVVDDPGLAERLRSLRYHGIPDRENCLEVSHNARLHTVQAAMLLVRLNRLEALLAARRRIAADYCRRLSDLVEVPRQEDGCGDVPFAFTIRTPKAQGLAEHLRSNGIEVKRPVVNLMPRQPAYDGKCRGAFPRAEQLYPTLLFLPVHEKLTQDQCDTVVNAVRGYFDAL